MSTEAPLSSRTAPRALSLLAAMAPPLPVAWTPLAPSIFSWVSRTWPAEGKQRWAPQAAGAGAGGEDCPSASRLSDRYGFLGDSDEGTVAVGHIVETEGGAPRDVVDAAHLGPVAHTRRIERGTSCRVQAQEKATAGSKDAESGGTSSSGPRVHQQTRWRTHDPEDPALTGQGEETLKRPSLGFPSQLCSISTGRTISGSSAREHDA